MRKRLIGRRGRLRRTLTAGIPPLLIRSNGLLAAGQYAQAADGLEQLARAADARGARRAPVLYLEAGRARIMAAQAAQGLDLIQRGLELMAASGLARRLARPGNRLITELHELGFDQEARQITAFLKDFAPDLNAAVDSPAAVRRPHLPTRCPACAAPVRPDEVEWLDETTAECPYCGSAVREE
ncbi:MAG: hypothetical protein V1755_11875 [Chloroflexota bacterium]